MLLFLDDGGEALSPLLQTLGRMHPLVVHLPIGLLMALGVVEAWAMLRGKQRERKGSAAFVWFAALGASLAMGAGLLLHEEGGYGDIVETHEVLGIAVAGLSLLAALCFTFRWTTAYRTFLFAAVLVLVPTGHFGAEMTHGKGFLTEPARRAMKGEKEEAAPQPPTDTADAEALAVPQLVSFEEHVAPILAASCVDCHGESKTKGGLAMHTTEGLLAGGFDGAPFVPGDTAASLMLQRTSLPLDDEDHMPPEGKPQPSAADLALLEAWIASGASFTEPFEPPAPEPETDALEPTPDVSTESAALAPDLPLQPAIGARADADDAPLATLSGKPASSAPQPLPRPPAAAPATLALMRENRWSLSPLEPNATLLSLDAQAAADRTDAGLAQALGTVAEQLGELNLARTDAAGQTLTVLAAATDLRRLDLTATPVDCSALAALAGHSGLRRLVLTETAVDDQAVDALLSLPALEQLYLVGTNVTDVGLTRLAEGRPDLELYPLSVDSAGPPLTEVLEEEPVPVLAQVAGAEQVNAAATASDVAGTAILATNTTCPVTGAPVSGEHAVLIAGKAVATCCAACALKVLQSPGEYGLE